MIDRSLRSAVGPRAAAADVVSQPENGSSSSTYQRGFASSIDGRSTRGLNQENETSTVPGPSSLSDLHQDTTSNLRSLRRRYLLPRSSINYFIPTEEEGRMGEMRTFPRPVSDDSASSSSLDSSSSVTSGVSGASHERNTRLSLLWTSRLNRAGGNESDNSAGGTYDLEERRGEGSVMSRGTRGLDTPEENSTLGDSSRGSRENIRERRSTSRVPGHEINPTGSRTSSTFAYADDTARVNEENEDESEGDSTQRSRQSGQGGRWMYYRGKFPIGVPTRNRGSGAGSSGGASSSPYRASTSRSSSSQPSLGNRSSIEDSLAIPGPSGLSGSSVNGHSSSQDPFAQDSSSSLSSQNYSQLDPQFGVRLLSRHIENMQSICRSLSIPRAQLEVTRHRSEISQLQQIRSMLHDIQHQIRSLRASVDQTLSEDYPVLSNDATLNSMAVNAEPLPTELINTNGGGLTDEVELEVNIGTDDADQFSYSTLAEEDPEQLVPDLSQDTMGDIHMSSENDSATLESIPENEASSRPSSSARLGSRTTRSASRTLRDLAVSRARSRRISRNRLVWTGLLRRLPLHRRASRSRLSTDSSPTPTSSEMDILRSVRRREIRESRLDKRRALILSRRSERRNGPTVSGLNSAESNSREGGGPSLEEHVRRRHTADWQRRLRSINVMDQLRQRNEEYQPTNSSGTAIIDYLRSHRRRANRNVAGSNSPNSNSISPPQPVIHATRPSAVTTTTTTSSVSTNTELQPSNNNTESDNDVDHVPERVTRTGPPTTSLSSRIATMLAQQREARNRSSTTEAAPGPSGMSSSASTPVRASGVFRLLYDSEQSDLGWQTNDDSPSDIFEDSFNTSRTVPTQEDGAEQDLSNGDFLSLPAYQSIRSLRREIIANRRNRMLRRFPSSLVSGGELAGATLAAINPLLASEQERHRDSYRDGGTESYRHTLQVMADRLNQMMNTSLSSSAHLREGNAGSFNNEDEEGEVMEHQNLRNVHGASSRRMASQRNSSDMPPYRPGSMLWSNYSSPSAAIDRHMQRSLFDPFSPGLCNGNNSYYRIQAWDFRHSDIPDISDSYSNIVVQRCRIHFDASVSVSVDGTLLAAVLPDTKTLTRIGVYSLESKTLGQLLYSSNIGYNIVCVSLSPTMRHLVVGISSHRLGVHHNDKQVIGRIYKLSHSKSSYKGSFPGILKFCKSIELQSEFRQSSLNCIRWIPIPGQGLVYGTNRGQLTVIR